MAEQSRFVCLFSVSLQTLVQTLMLVYVMCRRHRATILEQQLGKKLTCKLKLHHSICDCCRWYGAASTWEFSALLMASNQICYEVLWIQPNQAAPSSNAWLGWHPSGPVVLYTWIIRCESYAHQVDMCLYQICVAKTKVPCAHALIVCCFEGKSYRSLLLI